MTRMSSTLTRMTTSAPMYTHRRALSCLRLIAGEVRMEDGQPRVWVMTAIHKGPSSNSREDEVDHGLVQVVVVHRWSSGWAR